MAEREAHIRANAAAGPTGGWSTPGAAAEAPVRTAGAPGKPRFLGVDVTRGVALVAMLAANVWKPLGPDGGPSLAGMTVIGRSATLFVMVAGISLAFITGGRHPVQGRVRRAARANIAARAVLIGAIGLALGYVATISVILAYYGAFFLLAIPLVGLRPRTLAGIAVGLVVVSPLILLASYALGWEEAVDRLTLSAPLSNPGGFVQQLLVTGDFPAVTNMAYICAGLAIGRLNLSSTTVARRLLVGGLATAVVTWFVSWLVLYPLGGLQHLLAAGAGATPDQVVWDADEVPSWWWLGVNVHHSGAPLDMLHTVGCAIAVLGAVLLVTKLPAARRLLWPIGVAGAMTLTIYSTHTPFALSDLVGEPLARYLIIIGVALPFAVLWHKYLGQGPLERFVAAGANRARAAVLAAPDRHGVVAGPGSPG
ncbi:heparan-alpha-glucosaminide N-acetyltransferase domain-containing protein [Georgenia ruanii]|uniref:heparan-alpha-glucosaminide N-acetyltransferase domain-containing protein n=1 Tax=Georgenia ruanii TaxID=348442 RepID=UPI001265844B|nr:heparan-alpha-glucosaminide N-acetyltransferase domain-containing protein [Georgenia ruanii]